MQKLRNIAQENDLASVYLLAHCIKIATKYIYVSLYSMYHHERASSRNQVESAEQKIYSANYATKENVVYEFNVKPHIHG